MGIKSESIATL